uniref:Uncharacterized protein n=1 Tax=Chlamydomonas subcaudata TaxID=163303 RepID=E3SDK4_CHLSU|nr:unknown [Chlamydomonas subcaudata]AFU83028.1 unknown [Chlamydomonas subcaudata]
MGSLIPISLGTALAGVKQANLKIKYYMTIFKTKGKKKNSKFITRVNLCIDDLEIKDLISVIALNPKELIVDLILDVACGLIAILIMVQLRISVINEKPAYMDQLPSYKLYKKNLIQGFPGRSISALYALYKTLPVLDDVNPVKVGEILMSKIGIATPNSKRLKSPSKGNWQDFLNGEMAVVLGKLISCPSNNLFVFGITSAWAVDVSVDTVLVNYRKVVFSVLKESEYADKFTNEAVFKKFKTHLLTGAGGYTREMEIFYEPNNIKSKIESEFLTECLVRNGVINSTLTVTGEIPDSPLTENMINTHLTETERIQYSSAMRQGLKDCLRTLNQRAKQRLARSEKNAQAALSSNESETIPSQTLGINIPEARSKRSRSSRSPSNQGTTDSVVGN